VGNVPSVPGFFPEADVLYVVAAVEVSPGVTIE
jgi:hypothetical protein